MRLIVQGKIRTIRALSRAQCSGRRSSPPIAALVLLLSWLPRSGASQCAAIASTPNAAADCAAHNIPQGAVTPLDTAHTYSFHWLIDVA